jgi:hypothetical protein
MILFPDATDRLTNAVTHQQLADRLGVSVQRVRQARLPDGHAGKRPPPPGWEAAVVELARQQARQLDALADALASAEIPQTPEPQVQAPDREAQSVDRVNMFGLRPLRSTSWGFHVPESESEWDFPPELLGEIYIDQQDFLSVFTAGQWYPHELIGLRLGMAGFPPEQAVRVYTHLATRAEKRKYGTGQNPKSHNAVIETGTRKLAEALCNYLAERGVLESKQEGGGTYFRLPPAE